MTLNIITTRFKEYTFSVGDWAKVESDDGEKYVELRNRRKTSFDTAETSADSEEPVYKAEFYDADEGELTGTETVVAQSDLAEWSGPEADTDDAGDDAGLVYDDAGDPLSLTFSALGIGETEKEGFNEFGVRENYGDDGELLSVDAVYEAMEPGPPEDRNGFRVTANFLRTIANKSYERDPPFMMDHSENTLSQIGFMKDVWFDEQKEKLMVLTRTYNTGGDIHDEIINRLTHEPPATPGGSVGLNQSYSAIENERGELELIDGRIEEFSTTPFPGGYDEGGLRASGSAD